MKKSVFIIRRNLVFKIAIAFILAFVLSLKFFQLINVNVTKEVDISNFGGRIWSHNEIDPSSLNGFIKNNVSKDQALHFGEKASLLYWEDFNKKYITIWETDSLDRNLLNYSSFEITNEGYVKYLYTLTEISADKIIYEAKAYPASLILIGFFGLIFSIAWGGYIYLLYVTFKKK